MEIWCEWKDGKYPSFNVSLASKEGVEPFIVIKGCGIMNGSNGEFVKYPSRKMDNGKYFNYIYANEKFNVVVLEKAKQSMPKTEAKSKPSIAEMDDDIPF